jgi:hypothetical protein
MCIVDSCKSSTQSNFKSDMLICLDSITVTGRVLVQILMSSHKKYFRESTTTQNGSKFHLLAGSI